MWWFQPVFSQQTFSAEMKSINSFIESIVRLRLLLREAKLAKIEGMINSPLELVISLYSGISNEQTFACLCLLPVKQRMQIELFGQDGTTGI